MNRAKVSLKYANECQRIITECGDDYKKAASLLYDINVPSGVHPMLSGVADLAELIVDNYRGEESEKHYFYLIKTTVAHFLADEWEPSAWLAIVVYGHEEDGITKYSYGLSIRRQGATTTYESGNEQLVSAIEKLADSIDQNQTDEWFIHSLTQKLPEKIDDLMLQSCHTAEVTTSDWSDIII